MSRARTLIVAANDVFFDGLVEWVAHDGQLDVVGRARSGAQALERLEDLRVDVVLMDVTLPDQSGFEVARRITSRADAPLVVLLSFHDNHAARLEAWAAGADGFVAKSETTECLSPLVGNLLRKRRIDVREEVSINPNMPAKQTDTSK